MSARTEAPAWCRTTERRGGVRKSSARTTTGSTTPQATSSMSRTRRTSSISTRPATVSPRYAPTSGRASFSSIWPPIRQRPLRTTSAKSWNRWTAFSGDRVCLVGAHRFRGTGGGRGKQARLALGGRLRGAFGRHRSVLQRHSRCRRFRGLGKSGLDPGLRRRRRGRRLNRSTASATTISNGPCRRSRRSIVPAHVVRSADAASA